jgi:opacity protein-like surface antigen
LPDPEPLETVVKARSILSALLLVSAPATLIAQNYREVPPEGRIRALGGINLQLGVPEGEFANFVETGYGVGGNLTLFIDHQSRVGIRLFGSWLQYGRTTERVPFPGLPGISVDLTTSNNIYSFGVGPEFHLSTGGIRPYIQGAIGLSNFATATSAEGSDNTNPFARTTNFNDWTVALYGGGGLQFQVSHGRNPVFIDGGARYQSHGRTRYLREGSLQQAPGGGVTIDPIESKTDLLIIHLGVQVGI